MPRLRTLCTAYTTVTIQVSGFFTAIECGGMNVRKVSMILLYRGEVIYWVKGSVQVLFKFALHRKEREREKGGDANFKTKHT